MRATGNAGRFAGVAEQVAERLLGERATFGADDESHGDIEEKLDVLRVECTKCNRKGRYTVAKLIEKHGRKGNLMKWREQLNGDCPKRDGRLNDRCDLVCPDLPKVL